MIKVWTLAPKENWICDRMVQEWITANHDMVEHVQVNANCIWLLADWCWRSVPYHILSTRKVVTTVHHIVPDKFGHAERVDFDQRDKITDHYHVYNERTYNFIRPLTMKPITLIPYWANQTIWKRDNDNIVLRGKHGLPVNDFLIGSFQRDTEGFDLKSPKLEKGPDLLADYVIYKNSLLTANNLHVVLAGWRRQYIMSRLNDSGIKYTYFERPDLDVINELYQTLDLYPVAARHEGGPQSLIECGLIGVPVISRPVGIAEQVLPSYAIASDLKQAIPCIPKVDKMLIPQGFELYRNFFQNL